MVPSVGLLFSASFEGPISVKILEANPSFDFDI